MSRSPRPWSQIRGVCFHQVGAAIAEHPERWDTLNAHIAMLRNGTLVLVNDPTMFIWHAQGLSESTIGIECNGNFLGVQSDPRTWWRAGGGPYHLVERQLEAAPVLFDWLLGEFSAHGASWERVHAHRQSAASRRADPGSEIWRRVALPWMAQLGLTGELAGDGGEGWHLGEGRGIPREWDPERKGRY